MWVGVWHTDSQWQLTGSTMQSSSTVEVGIPEGLLPPRHRTPAAGMEQWSTHPQPTGGFSHCLLTRTHTSLSLTVALHPLSLQLLSRTSLPFPLLDLHGRGRELIQMLVLFKTCNLHVKYGNEK